ncbi:MAG: ribosome small subunit-dependent GTPase A [Cyclobacteriaceae bacterium]
MEDKQEALVLKSTGSWYKVRTLEGAYFDAKLRGKHKVKGIRSTNPIAVGDKVLFELDQSGDEEIAIIIDIQKRENYIARKSINKSANSHILAANVDQAVLVATIQEPATSLGFIDRFLVVCESFRIPAIIVFNKSDLFTEGAKEYFNQVNSLYHSIGYTNFAVSAKLGDDINKLKELLKGKKTLLSGHSGVGKSSLINKIYPEKDLKIGDLSTHHNKGKHTTTFAEMLELEANTYVIDSPGIQELGLVDMEPETISHYFPEMRKVLGECKFNNCSHIHEPGCVIKEEVDSGKIYETRYMNYLSMYSGEDFKES